MDFNMLDRDHDWGYKSGPERELQDIVFHYIMENNLQPDWKF